MAKLSIVVALGKNGELTEEREITSGLESVQDFLIKLGIKPLIHLLEILEKNYEQSRQKMGTFLVNKVFHYYKLVF